MNIFALKANDWGLWLVNETDQGTEFISCVDWKVIAAHLEDHLSKLEKKEKNDD